VGSDSLIRRRAGRSLAEPVKDLSMTTLEHRPSHALLVIDVQTAAMANAHERDAVVARISKLVDRARAAHVPVIWVQHDDDHFERSSEAWQLVPELVPIDGEPRIEKQYGDAFEETALESELAARGVGRLLVVGAQTDQCIRGTLHGALVRGYDVTLVSDAHTTEDQTSWGAPPPEQVIAHTNLYWRPMRPRPAAAPARFAATRSTSPLPPEPGSKNGSGQPPSRQPERSISGTQRGLACVAVKDWPASHGGRWRSLPWGVDRWADCRCRPAIRLQGSSDAPRSATRIGCALRCLPI
jgi:hypothetical protein